MVLLSDWSVSRRAVPTVTSTFLKILFVAMGREAEGAAATGRCPSVGPASLSVRERRETGANVSCCGEILLSGFCHGALFRHRKRPCIPLFIRETGPSSNAVTVGFEPTLAFTPNNISSVAPSAARTRHQRCHFTGRGARLPKWGSTPASDLVERVECFDEGGPACPIRR